jgi:hypothetical protein
MRLEFGWRDGGWVLCPPLDKLKCKGFTNKHSIYTQLLSPEMNYL